LWASYDAGVSGKDPIEGRPGFKALLERVAGNGVRVVIVEDASRFARHLLTQEAGISLLVGLGVRVLTAAGDGLTDSDMNSGPPCGRSWACSRS
jgi:DNA invertase Pin-like site-specific DNA recombinase